MRDGGRERVRRDGERGRGADHLDGFGDLADIQADGEVGGARGFDRDVLEDGRLEPRESDRHLVAAGLEIEEQERALVVGDAFARDVGALVAERDGRARHGIVLGVGDGAGDGADGADLGEHFSAGHQHCRQGQRGRQRRQHDGDGQREQRREQDSRGRTDLERHECPQGNIGS